LEPDDLRERLSDLLAGFRDASGPDRMKRGVDLVALVAGVPADDRASLLRSARAADTLVPLLAAENTSVALSAVKLLADSAEPKVVPPMLEAAARAPSLRAYVADAARRILAASGGAGASMAGDLALSPDAFVRAIGVACASDPAAALDDPSPAVRARALEGLARVPVQERTIPALVERLRVDADRSVRLAAVRVVSAWHAAVAAPVLQDALLHDADALVRRAVVEALATVRPPGAFRWLASALGDADVHVADAALAALVAGAPEDALDGLARVLAEGSASPRVAEAASGFGIEGLDLLALMCQDARPALREAACGLTSAGGSSSACGQRLAQRACAFDGPVGPGGRAALWTLAWRSYGWPATLGDVELMLRGLDDPAPEAREAAWEALRWQLARSLPRDRERMLERVARHPDGATLLVRAAAGLRGDPSREARLALARLRGVDSDDGARLVDVPSLLASLRASAAPTRVFAARVLGRFACRDARAPLERALDDPDRDVREAAATALGELGDERAAGALRRALVLHVDDVELKAELVAALGAAGDLPSLLCLAALAQRSELDAVAALARRLGPAAYDAIVSWMAGPEANLRAGLVAAGASGDPRAVDLLSNWLPRSAFTPYAVRGLGETRLAAALPALLHAPVALGVPEDDVGSRELHEALADALDAVVAAAPEAVPGATLDLLASLDVVRVRFLAGDVYQSLPVSYGDVRARAGDERVRRGGVHPGPGSVTTLATWWPLAPDPAPAAPPFLRLARAGDCACGGFATLETRVPGWWIGRCTSGHDVRFVANYVPLGGAGVPRVDVSFAQVFERWIGAPLPFALPPGCRTFEGVTEGTSFWELAVASPEADRPLDLAQPPSPGERVLGFVGPGPRRTFVILDRVGDRAVALRHPFDGPLGGPEGLESQRAAVRALALEYAAIVAGHAGC
jgi:HEAT repeat protein